MIRCCASCGRRLPAGPTRETSVTYSRWTKSYYCGPKQDLDACRARARKLNRKATA